MSVAVSRSTAPADTGADQQPCRLARSVDERAQHFAVRHEVFVVEQGIFHPDDHDGYDEDPHTLHAIGGAGGAVGGAVRLYRLPDETWKGDRLAVLPAYRRGLLGASLVRFAVATAGARGGARMVAMIQLANVPFFQSLGWSETGPVTAYHGVAHQPMAIPLRSPRGGKRRAR